MERLKVRDGQRDFDFIFGNWCVHNRRLRFPLSASGEWYEFDAAYTAQPLWGGKGNLDQFVAETPLGRIEALTLRLYDPQTGAWSLFWATARNGLTAVPNVGAFNEAGVGDFFSNEGFEGREIVCRYRWTKENRSNCRWEQAFSEDGGATWETNWVMEFARI